VNKQQREAEKEIRKIAGTLLLNHPTTPAEYKRLERQIQKVVKDSGKVSRWQKIRQNIIQSLEELDKELNQELVFRRKKG